MPPLSRRPEVQAVLHWGGGATRVSSSSRSGAPAVVSPPAVAAQTAQPVIGERVRSRSREGRRYSRSTIYGYLLQQWRGPDTPSRPLRSDAERADADIVPREIWADGLVGEGLVRTRELLNSARWRRERTRSSVHLCMYLGWAEGQVARLDAAEVTRASSRQAGLELGRVIQHFL